jgi:hypothetical protein
MVGEDANTLNKGNPDKEDASDEDFNPDEDEDLEEECDIDANAWDDDENVVVRKKRDAIIEGESDGSVDDYEARD